MAPMVLARALRASQASAGGAATRDRGLYATAVTADPTTRSYVQKPALPGRWLAPQGYQLKAGSQASSDGPLATACGRAELGGP